jgi:uncharacterized membrane protein (DUF106 family)
MKRIAAFMLLLVALCVAGALPVQAQTMTREQYARKSRKEMKHQQKAMKKAAKQQRKAMKKAQKAQMKATRKANRRYKKR